MSALSLALAALLGTGLLAATIIAALTRFAPGRFQTIGAIAIAMNLSLGQLMVSWLVWGVFMAGALIGSRTPLGMALIFGAGAAYLVVLAVRRFSPRGRTSAGTARSVAFGVQSHRMHRRAVATGGSVSAPSLTSLSDDAFMLLSNAAAADWSDGPWRCEIDVLISATGENDLPAAAVLRELSVELGETGRLRSSAGHLSLSARDGDVSVELREHPSRIAIEGTISAAGENGRAHVAREYEQLVNAVRSARSVLRGAEPPVISWGADRIDPVSAGAQDLGTAQRAVERGDVARRDGADEDFSEHLEDIALELRSFHEQGWSPDQLAWNNAHPHSVGLAISHEERWVRL